MNKRQGGLGRGLDAIFHSNPKSDEVSNSGTDSGDSSLDRQTQIIEVKIGAKKEDLDEPKGYVNDTVLERAVTLLREEPSFETMIAKYHRDVHETQKMASEELRSQKER